MAIPRPASPYNNIASRDDDRTKALRAISKIRVIFRLSHDEIIFIAQKLKEISESNPKY